MKQAALILSLALAACGGGGGSDGAPAPEAIQRTTETSPPADSTPSTGSSSSSEVVSATITDTPPQSSVGGSSSSAAPVAWSNLTPSTPRSSGDILRSMASVYPVGNTDLLRLAFGADQILKIRSESMTAGDSSQYLKVVKYLCDYEVRRDYTEWLINDGQHATVEEQRDHGNARDAAAKDCQTAGDTLSEVELAVEATKPLALPVDHALTTNPAPPPSPSTPFSLQEWRGFQADVIGKIELNQQRARAALGQDVMNDRRLNMLIDGLNQQANAWRNSQSLEEVRGKIDEINAKYQAQLAQFKH